MYPLMFKEEKGKNSQKITKQILKQDDPGCRIIDNGMFGQISVRTAFKQKLAGTVLEQC